MAKVFVIPAMPQVPKRRKAQGLGETKYIEGQRLLVEAMKYLAQSDRRRNKPAIELLSEHFRTQFRMSDSPLG